MDLLAIKVAKARASFWRFERETFVGGRLRRATEGKGAMGGFMFKALEIELNMDFQNVINVGQSQNMCINVAGACLHLSHIGSMSGLILESLALVQYTRWINLS